MILTIEEGIELVVKEAKKGYDQVKKEEELMEKTDGNLKKIVTKTTSTATEIRSISKSLDEQMTTVKEVIDAMKSITKGSSNIEHLYFEQMENMDSIVKRLENILNSAENLEEVSSKLKNIVSEFKIE
jgi:methyl-accepting chemotaxis protein